MNGTYAQVGFVTFLFGIFSAYWAQITGRNAWAWFFFGLFLAPIALQEREGSRGGEGGLTSPMADAGRSRCWLL
jgi:hypothetical protein